MKPKSKPRKLKNGLVKEHYAKGELASVGRYVDGARTGVWKF